MLRDDSNTVYLAGFLTGLLVGALAILVFDPKRRGRRALARRPVVQYGSEISEWRASRQRAITRPL